MNDDEMIEPPEDAMEDNNNDSTEPAWIDLLQADTPEDEVHQRAALGKGGSQVMRDGKPLMLNYVTARFVMDRLDAAVGPMNWRTEFESLPSGAVRCGISIREPGDRGHGSDWITKWDVGVPSTIEPDKGAHSDAFKRAGVHWGIARDLYDARDEDRLSAPIEPSAANTQTQTVREQVQQPQQMQPQVVQQYREDGQPGWLCPIHSDMKVVPGGVSKRTGRAYRAFYACPVAGCDEKGPSA